MAAEEEEIVDRMSALPDEVLCYILSFLPSKCSIRTSSLSTRFRYLWRSVPALEFRDVCDPRYFEEITNYALNNHESLAIIRRFHLSLGEFSYRTSEISGLIDLCIAASYSNLEVLHVHIAVGDFVFLSPKIFSGRKLKSICLSGRIGIEIPVDVCASFPCLENLTFKSASLKSGNLLSKLLSGCPRLKTCDIIDCELTVSLEIFSGRKLKSLCLSGRIGIEIPLDVCASFPCLENLTFKSVSLKGGKLLSKLLSGCPRLKTCDIIDCELVIPLKIFSSCRKLKSICLSGRIHIKIPLDVCASFPCLENLTFKSVSLKGGKLLSKLKTCNIIDCKLVIPLTIFSSCRKLKSISLSGEIVIKNSADVCLSFPRLEDFTFRSLWMKGGSNTLTELISICPRLKTCDIIDCKLSNEFHLLGRPDKDTIKKLHLEYHVKDGDSVSPQASASIDISSSTSNSKMAFDLLKHISNITKHLEICKPRNIGFKNGGVIVWQNLTHLVVKMLWCSSPALSLLLEHSPNLISLVLEKDIFGIC